MEYGRHELNSFTSMHSTLRFARYNNSIQIPFEYIKWFTDTLIVEHYNKHFTLTKKISDLTLKRI